MTSGVRCMRQTKIWVGTIKLSTIDSHTGSVYSEEQQSTALHGYRPALVGWLFPLSPPSFQGKSPVALWQACHSVGLSLWLPYRVARFFNQGLLLIQINYTTVVHRNCLQFADNCVIWPIFIRCLVSQMTHSLRKPSVCTVEVHRYLNRCIFCKLPLKNVTNHFLRYTNYRSSCIIPG